MGLTSLDLRSAAGMLAAQQFPNVGPKTALQAALTDETTELERRKVTPAELMRAFKDAQEQLKSWEDSGLHVLALFDERYPERLRYLHEPPPLLWVRGDVDVLSRDELAAVIGTREPSRFGITAAETFTDLLAADGWGIVSGLAKGCDTIAHTRALEDGAPTIAVLGGGLGGSIYPAQNKELAQRIVDSGGALVSEQPLKARPTGPNLVRRDRIQSGLSAGVIVAQTGVKGGSMHTVRYAVEQGRPVICPDPGASNGQSDGLRLLIEKPGRELCHVIPAWSKQRRLCLRLGDQPVAQPVARGDLERTLDMLRLSLSLWAEEHAGDGAIRPPADL
jgi:DNA processing protein